MLLCLNILCTISLQQQCAKNNN